MREYDEKVSPETSQRLSNARISFFFFKKNQENNGMWKEKLCFHGRGYKNQAYCVQVELQSVFERAREILLQFSKVPFYVCVDMNRIWLSLIVWYLIISTRVRIHQYRKELTEQQYQLQCSRGIKKCTVLQHVPNTHTKVFLTITCDFPQA